MCSVIWVMFHSQCRPECYSRCLTLTQSMTREAARVRFGMNVCNVADTRDQQHPLATVFFAVLFASHCWYIIDYLCTNRCAYPPACFKHMIISTAYERIGLSSAVSAIHGTLNRPPPMTTLGAEGDRTKN